MKKILVLAAGLLVSACAVDVQPGVYGSTYVAPAPVYVHRPVYTPYVPYVPRLVAPPVYRPYGYHRPYHYRRY